MPVFNSYWQAGHKSLVGSLATVRMATSGFSELDFPVFPTTSTVAVGLLYTGKDGQDGQILY
jgi:hypothetical protein